MLFNFYGQGNSVISNNMDDLGEHYPKWSKPNAERQMLYNLTHIRSLKWSNKVPEDTQENSRKERKEGKEERERKKGKGKKKGKERETNCKC